MHDSLSESEAGDSGNDGESGTGAVVFAEQLTNAANALDHIELQGLSDLFRRFSARVTASVAAESGEPVRLANNWRAWCDAWVQWFTHPAPVTLEQALTLHLRCESGVSQESLEPLRRSLQSIKIVASRRIVPAVAAESDDELSLEIPAGADHEVVGQLINELPGLANRFAVCVTRIEKGDLDQVGEARRIAHTVKGAANTVGIRGIAKLTHALEDLLQLLSEPEDRPDAEQVTVLADGADCLADMVDALVGVGENPPQAVPVYRSIVELVHDLLPVDGEAGPSEVAAVNDASELHITDFDLPDLNLTATAATDAVPGPAVSIERVVGAASARAAKPVSESASKTDSKTDSEPTTEPVSASPTSSVSGLQIQPASVDRLMETANEAVITLSQLQEVLRSTNALRERWQHDAERLQLLTSELDRLLDAGPVVPSDSGSASVTDGGLDPLEMERYSELHTVSRRLSEVGADGKLMDQQLTAELARLGELASKLESMQGDIRDRALAIRMVDAGSIETRLQRVARQAARLSGKTIDLQLDGADTAIDSDLLHRLLEPLAHLVRNAVDHGLESTERRQEQGKLANGQIVVSFAREAGNVRVSVRDDGAGLDIKAIAKRAVALGLVPKGTKLEAVAAAQLVLAPGFSTREKASQLSGRGIGLDVVSQVMRGLRGDLAIHTELRLGTNFDMVLPMQMTSVPVFVLRSETHVLALSIRGIEQILSSAEFDDQARAENRLAYGERVLEVRRLDEALGLPAGLLGHNKTGARAKGGSAGLSAAGDETGEVIAVVQTAGGGLTALLMPDPGQTRQTVVRAVPAGLPHIPGVDGVAVLGDGAVAPVFDLPELITTSADASPDTRIIVAEHSNAPLCLVVDDSVSVRRATEQFVSDLGFSVSGATDGRDAIDTMIARRPALIVTDLEMPGMNGIDFVRELRADARFSEIPVVMLTSRQSDRHRGLALEAGVSAFVTKPYSEDDFAALVNRLIK